MNIQTNEPQRSNSAVERQMAGTIAATIRERRVRLRVSQQYLATVAGCSLGTVARIEAGPPSLEMADRLDAALSQLEAEAVTEA